MKLKGQMKKLFLYLSLCICLQLAACVKKYDFGTYPYIRKPVVMSIINPDSLIKVKVYWNKPTGLEKNFEMIDGATVEVLEEGVSLFKGETTNGIAKSTKYPCAGKSYSLKVHIEGEPEITASTEIPMPANIEYKVREKNGGKYHSYIAADVSSITLPDNAPAALIYALYDFDNPEIDVPYSICLYSNCSFLDPINSTTDPMDAILRESNIVYEGQSIRIKRSSLDLATPFTFSFAINWIKEIYDSSQENWWENIETYYAQNAIVHIISPSSDYDRFERTAYKQWRIAWEGSPFAPDPVSVYSNINNGVGIFAGYSITEVKQPVNNPYKQ